MKPVFALLLFALTLGSPQFSRASLLISYTVDQTGHLLDGATITSRASGNFTWTVPTGFNPSFRYAAFNATWTTTSSGATGPGSIWNGDYTFFPSGGWTNIGIRHTSTLVTAAARFTDTGTTSPSGWSDGSKVFSYQVTDESVGPLPDIGDPVLLPSDGTPNYRGGVSHTSGGIAFATISTGSLGGGFMATIPEPSKMALIVWGRMTMLGQRRRK